jgi:HK97 gp10 family phage protein
VDTTVEIAGLREVEEALSQAGPKLARRALRKALKAGAETFKSAAKRNAPVLTKGTTQRRPGELRDAIDLDVALSGKQESGVARVGIRRDRAKGAQSPSVWGSMVEFGSVHGKAQPFMRPAFAQAKSRAQEVFTEEIRKGVESLGK